MGLLLSILKWLTIVTKFVQCSQSMYFGGSAIRQSMSKLRDQGLKGYISHLGAGLEITSPSTSSIRRHLGTS